MLPSAHHSQIAEMSSQETIEVPNVDEQEDEDVEQGSVVASVVSLQNTDTGKLEDTGLVMTASMKDIYADMESPLSSKTNFRITTDVEDTILKNAVRNIKANFDETKVISELRKMYDWYLQSQAENQLLVNKIEKLLDKIDKYETRHKRDPRVMAALKMADRHRSALKIVEEAKKDSEAEKIEAKLEVKHLEDAMKTKNREIAKMQDEIKKLKDIEKNAEIYETQLIRKENELRTTKEKCEADIINVKLGTREEMLKEFALKRDLEKEVKEAIPDIKRHEYDLNEKRTLQKEIEEKTKLLNTYDMDRKSKKLLLESCRDKGKIQSMTIRRMLKKNAMLRKEKLAAENENCKWKLSYETLKIEFAKANEQIEELRTTTLALKAKVRKAEVENHDLVTALRDMQTKLSYTSQNLSQCHINSATMQTELKLKSEDLTKTNLHLQTKSVICDQLSKKCNLLQQQKLEQLELLRMSQSHAMTLAKDVTGLRMDSVKQYKRYQDLLTDRARMRANLFLVKGRYFEAEDKCQVLRSEKEMQKLYAYMLEQQAVEIQRKLQSIVQTNIQLYCENTTQEEVAVLQNNQYKIKEKEIQGLEFSSQEQDEVISKLEQTCKERTHVIEQLSADLISRNALLKSNKALIQTMTNEERILKCQLGHLQEKEKEYKTALDLLRRQRDLFGTQLLRTQAELGLVKKQMNISDAVMQKSNIAHINLLNDMKILKLEIRDLRRKLKIQEGNALMIDSLRQELAKLASSLELEKAKARTLEETRTPIIHRWRAVMASDPSKYELFMKMNKLTKRLIDKTTEVTEKEMIIQQKDYYMMEIQTLMARRFMPHINPELNQAKAIIRKQTKQLQALQGELNITRHDLTKQSSMIEKNRDHLLEANKKITQQQRINQKLMAQKQIKLPSICPQIIRTQVKRYL